MSARLIAIGDIHGCSKALNGILSQIDPQPDDTIATLGDYVDCGPHSKDVLYRLIELGKQCCLIPLLGNHELMLLTALDGDLQQLESWIEVGGGPTLDSYGNPRGLADIPSSHLDFLRRCHRYYETESHIFVHANYWPNRRMDEQAEGTMLWEPLDSNWTGPHCSGKPVILGHTPQMSGEILDLGYLKCIDTGCGYGGRLTALELLSSMKWQADENGNQLI